VSLKEEESSGYNDEVFMSDWRFIVIKKVSVLWKPLVLMCGVLHFAERQTGKVVGGGRICFEASLITLSNSSFGVMRKERSSA